MPILGIYASSMQPALNASSFESIATVTVGAGGSSSITFSSIPSTYKHLEIRGIGRIASGAEAVLMQFNSDTGNNYAIHYLMGNGSAASAGASTTRSSMGLFWGMGIPSGASTFGAAVVSVLDYANTNKYKTIRSLDGYDANGTGAIELASGLWQSTSAVSSITLTPNSSAVFQQYSSFALYGIKGA